MTDHPERQNESETPTAADKPKAKGGYADRVLDHTYDGIQEYDNPMPRWWLGTFAATIVFSVLYVFNIGPIGSGKGWIADYEADMKAFAAAHPAPSGNDVSEAALAALVSDPKAVAAGKTTLTRTALHATARMVVGSSDRISPTTTGCTVARAPISTSRWWMVCSPRACRPGANPSSPSNSRRSWHTSCRCTGRIRSIRRRRKESR